MLLDHFQDFFRNESEFESIYDEIVTFLSIYTGEDALIYYNMRDDKLLELYKSIDFFKGEFIKHFSTEFITDCIEYNQYKFYRKEFDELTMGELIDIEYYLSGDVLPVLNLHIICSILFRLRKDGGILYEDVYEDYKDVAIHKRSEIFKEYDYKNFTGLIELFKQWRNDFLSKWSVISMDNIGEDLDNETLSDEDIQIIKEEIEFNKQNGKLIYDRLIYILSDGIPSETALCYDMNVYEFFNKLEIKNDEMKKRNED